MGYPTFPVFPDSIPVLWERVCRERLAIFEALGETRAEPRGFGCLPVRSSCPSH